MKSSTFIFFIIVGLIIYAIYVNITQQSSPIAIANQLKQETVSQEIVNNEIDGNKGINIKNYPPTAIWKAGESLKLKDVKSSQNGLYKIVVEENVVDGFKLTNLNSYNPKFDQLSDLYIKNPRVIAGDSGEPSFTLQNDGVHVASNIETSVIGFTNNTVFNKGCY